jgi:cupin 2 domain-containing protein
MTLRKSGNLFEGLSPGAGEEIFTTLAQISGARIERIVSTGQASPPGFWYDQDGVEWVLLLSGSAALRFEDEAAPRLLRPGDFVEIPAHARHRIDWTDATAPTIWLAVHGASAPARE